MKKFKIRITKCSGIDYWYLHRIGSIFTVTGVWGTNSFVIEDKSFLGTLYVKWADCEIYSGGE